MSNRPPSFTTSMNKQTFVSLLAARAEREPGRLAFTYLGDGERESARLTFGDLDRRAREIAGALQARGLAGERVLLLYPPGLDYIEAFFGCLYAGAIAVPAYPPDPLRLQRSVPRLEAIGRDAVCGAVLTTQAIHQLARVVVDEAPHLKALPWIASDQITGQANDWHAPTVDLQSVAFLQYTSGSTGQPRGVVLTHANLLHNQLLIRRAFESGPDASVVSWLPLYHDMGLIGTVLQPIFIGAHVCLMSPLSFLQRPLRWLQAITKYRAGYTGGPSFAFELCVRKITAAERHGLDLSSLKVAFCGAEPVRAATLESFTAMFAECGFRREAFHPTYGLAEATLMATGGHTRHGGPMVRWFATDPLNRGDVVPVPAGPGALALVGCGERLDDTELAIVDSATGAVAADGKVGEIWLRSPSVASGYFNRAAETAAVFGATLAGAGERPFLRTGDLGFLWEDELFFAGRVKDILIVRGKNYFPQDLEATVEQACPELFRPGCASAFSMEIDGEERVVIIQEVQRGSADRSRLARAVADATQAVFEEHGVGLHALVLIAAGELPKTSSGKVQRHAAHGQYVAGRFQSLVEASSAATTTERHSAAGATIAAQIERIRPLLARYVSGDASGIDAERPVSAYGLDSLSMVEFHAALEAELGSSVPIALLLAGPSLRDLAIALAETPPAGAEVSAGAEGPAGAAVSANVSDRLAWSWISRIDDELRPLLLALLDRVLARDDTVGYPGPISRAQGEQVMEELDRDLAHGRCHVLICRLGGRIVGRCTLTPSGSPNTKHTGWISRAMVDPDLRTANLLPLACSHIVERCRELNLEVLCLDTRVGSRVAKLWHALGFREFGRLPDYSRIGTARYEGAYMHQRVDDLARAASAVVASAGR